VNRQNDASIAEDVPMTQEEIEPAAVLPVEALAPGKKRPRIDLTTDSRERKRGKSMFGILLGTLNKAKKEDHDRNASEAVSSNPVVIVVQPLT
jgi:pinin/SDK/memA/ protein conserved region